jgi:hypothetical protein
MNSIGKNSIISLFVGIVLISCEPSFDLENCTLENRFILESGELSSLEFCSLNLGEESVNRKLVIKSQREFENSLICSPEYSEIDFDTNFILLGSYSHSQCIEISSQTTYICNSRLVYEVLLIETWCQFPTVLEFGKIISKDYEDLKIIFDVKFIENEN